MPVPVPVTAEAIARAADALLAGELVAFPTETVYGLGADATNPLAVAKIFAAKGRPATNPLIVHVADVAMARAVVADWPAEAEALAAAFWPGPLTLVLPKAEAVPLAVTAGLSAVGVRMPAHPVALALVTAAGLPVAAPSANPYMAVSPTTAAHVAAGLGDRVALILDGGASEVGLESTVVDLTGAVPRVLRPGGLPLARLREVLGPVEALAPGADREHLPSPGLARRHYAPRARVRLVAASAIAGAVAGASGRKGLLALAPMEVAADWSRALGETPEAYAAGLYAALHEADAAGLDTLFVALPPETEAWAAVRDRLRRAASELP